MSAFNPSNPLLLKSSKPETKTLLEDQLLGEDLPGNQKLNRNELRLSYDSDSDAFDSDEEGEEESKAAVPGKDSDDDMFASDKEEEIRFPKSAPKFLDMEKFARDEDLDHDSPASCGNQEGSEEEDEDEQTNKLTIEYYTNPEEIDIKKKKIPEPKFDAFNLREESKAGKFDMEGNYLREANSSEDENKPEDDWLKVKKSDIKKARKAKEERERHLKDRKQQKPVNSTSELLCQMIEILEPAESPIEALQRLNANRRHKRQRNKKKELRDEEQLKETHKNDLVGQITDLCGQIMDKNINDIYDLSREEIMRKYKVETGLDYKKTATLKRSRSEAGLNETEPESESKDGSLEDEKASVISDEYYTSKIWQFQWIGQEEIHGPYSAYEMENWAKTYFQNNVLVRQIGTSDFQTLESVKFS